jgi:hypothetical protein
MPGACCLKKGIDNKSICILSYNETQCNNFRGVYLGDNSVCTASGYCNVSPDGIVDDCSWCCGCKRSAEETRQPYYPCCFEDRNKDQICDCQQSYDPQYDLLCSGYAQSPNCDPNNRGYTIQKRNLILGGTTTEIEIVNCYTDVRIPRACCYMQYSDTNVPIGITCENVCNSRECNLKNISSAGTYPAVYSSGAMCNKRFTQGQEADYECFDTVDVIIGGETPTFRSSSSTKLNKFGACFTLNRSKDGKTFSYSCLPSDKASCNDYFVPISESGLDLCFSDYAPQTPTLNENNLVNPETMDFKSFLRLGLKFGDYFRGAYFVGIFTPNTSSVYGSMLTDFSKAQILQKSKEDVIGKTSSRSWALFVDNDVINTKFFKQNEKHKSLPKTSHHNGYYNCYGDSEFGGINNILVNTINKMTKKGLLGWYIPSLSELMFLSSKIVGNDENVYTFLTKMNSNGGIYISSTSINSSIMYSQVFDIHSNENFGKIIGVDTFSKNNVTIKLFKRIELTI